MTDMNSNILIVDDNPNNLQVLGSLLKSGNYRVAVSQNGRQALEYIKMKHPDLILLDVMMPEMDGFEVCRQIKKDETSKNIPVLFITALSDKEDKLRGFEVGGVDYITKPFLKEEVLARVNAVTERLKIENNLRANRKELKELNENLEQKVFERTEKMRHLQSQLVLQEKMASIGQLAAGLAHELNNPINFVYTNFVTLQENFTDFSNIFKEYRDFVGQMELEGKDLEYLEMIREKEEDAHIDFVLKDVDNLFSESKEGFDRVSWIINSMRNFSRVDQAGDMMNSDINKGITDTLVIARNEYKYSCEVDTELGDIDHLLCIPQQLNEVFLNLIVNAAQAIKDQNRNEKGNISVKTYMDGPVICCDISDDGPGIPDNIKQRIFEPFFTTKEVGKGTGLGLSISYDIVVNKHRGNLAVVDKKNGGTIFKIRLPGEVDAKEGLS